MPQAFSSCGAALSSQGSDDSTEGRSCHSCPPACLCGWSVPFSGPSCAQGSALGRELGLESLLRGSRGFQVGGVCWPPRWAGPRVSLQRAKPLFLMQMGDEYWVARGGLCLVLSVHGPTIGVRATPQPSVTTLRCFPLQSCPCAFFPFHLRPRSPVSARWYGIALSHSAPSAGKSCPWPLVRNRIPGPHARLPGPPSLPLLPSPPPFLQ